MPTNSDNRRKTGTPWVFYLAVSLFRTSCTARRGLAQQVGVVYPRCCLSTSAVVGAGIKTQKSRGKLNVKNYDTTTVSRAILRAAIQGVQMDKLGPGLRGDNT